LLPGQALLVPLGMATSGDGLRQASQEIAAGTGREGAVEEPPVLEPVTTALPIPEPERLGPPDPLDLSYTIKEGDTLETIARQYGMTAAALRHYNGLASEVLFPGEALKVPRPGHGPIAGGGPKRIEVDVSEQRMYVWQGTTLVWNLVASTGMDGYPTRRGTFAVQTKIDNAWSTPWQLWMPYWLGIYWAGGSENGIHALPIINGQKLWEAVLGSPVSYGCIVLATDDARRLYEWADMGTPVIIRD
jgi:lipoprotein-anchoring transpeptidase ErfK/SrfK